MSNPRRDLARAFHSAGHMPVSVDFQHGPTWEDVAMAIGRIRRPNKATGEMVPDRFGQHLITYIWGGQDWLRNYVIQSAMHDVAGLAASGNWFEKYPKSMGYGTLERLTSAALDERMHMDPCRRCAASGWVYLPAIKRDKVCPHCEGRGGNGWSQRQRADGLGCHLKAYQKTWAARYVAVLKLIEDKERRALAKVRAALRDAA